MGNQREIRQVLPLFQLGVAIPVRDGLEAALQVILAKHDQGRFYTYLASPDEDYTIPNMDHGDTHIGRSRKARFIIQSGGKMWCGYNAFCDHIAEAATFVEDALFFVGDDEDYIDRFEIENGTLSYDRVHVGCWRPVGEYIRERFPEIGT